MGKYILIFATILFSGCNDDFTKEIDNNKDDIKILQVKVKNLEEEINKIDKLEQKVKILQSRQENIQKVLKNNQILTKLASLNKEIQQIKNKNTFDYIVIHPVTLITIRDVNIYSSYKNGRIIKKWPAKTTFTSYKEKNGFVKVTGYFIHKKWVANDKSWWIKKTDVIIKRLEK